LELGIQTTPDNEIAIPLNCASDTPVSDQIQRNAIVVGPPPASVPVGHVVGKEAVHPTKHPARDQIIPVTG
jgi:hypothetical protein